MSGRWRTNADRHLVRIATLLTLVLGFAGRARADVPFSEPLVSITFDDGYDSQYTLAAPALAEYGYHATYYIITQALYPGWSGSLTLAHAKALDASGHEIASHTVSHPHLTTLSAAQLDAEIGGSQSWLVQNVGVPDVTDFASPFGEYNAQVLSTIKQYYLSHRTTNSVRNFQDSDPYRLGAYGADTTSTLAEIESYIDSAVAENSWAILYVHDISAGTPDTWGIRYSDFHSILDYIHARNIRVVTVGEGVALMNGATPSLTSVSPASGSTAGGTSVTLSGSNFISGAKVTFGGVAASVSNVTPTSIVATTPAHAAGKVDVKVTNLDGRSGTLTGGYTFTVPPPTISSISPTSGTTAGGTAVTVTGSGFQNGATVKFGSAAGTVGTVTATAISVTTPAEPAGTVSVTVTNPDGQSATQTRAYTFGTSPPFLSSLSPASGPTDGGTSVRLTGTGFLAGATVTFGTSTATVATVTATSISATTPAHAAGPVDVTVTNPDGQSSTLTAAFTYQAPPPSTGIALDAGFPVSVKGNAVASSIATPSFSTQGQGRLLVAVVTWYTVGNPVSPTVSGAGLTWTKRVDSFASGGWFGVAVWTASAASALTNQVVSATRVASQGTYTLAVYSLSGAQGLGASVAKQSPTSSSVPITAVISASAANSWILGGFLETNDGAGFPASSSTTFHVSNFDTSNGDSHAVGMLSKPTAAPGSVTLGSTASNRYVATAALEILADASQPPPPPPPPTLSSLSPTSGSTDGGTSVTLSGSGFLSGATVTFDGAAATVATVTATSISATAPAHAAGTVDVTVTNPDGQSSTLTGAFTYQTPPPPPPPTLSSLSPTSGSTDGGTSVTLSGSGFLSGATVTFDGAAATVATVTATSISATTPAHAAGTVDVTVTNPDGQSSTLTGAFTYQTPPPSTGIALDTGFPVSAKGNAVASSIATPSFSTQGQGRLLVAVVTWYTVGNPVSPTVSGAGLTWTKRADSFASGGWFGVAVWTASAASALTNQVVSATRVASQGTYTLAVYSLSGAQGLGASVAKQSPTSSSVPITAVISASAANSWILGGFLETNDGAGFPASSSTTFHVSNFDTSNGDSHAVGMLSKPTAAPGSVTLGSTASNRYVATAALEILADASQPPPPPPPPTLSSLSPTSGSTAGGTSVTLSGSSFLSGATVTFDGAAAAVATVTATSISATTPAHAAGPVDVTVTNPDGQSSTLTGAFTYQTPPPSTGIALDAGFPVSAKGNAVASSIATPSFSTQGQGRLLVAVVTWYTVGNPVSPTVSGAGLTWTKRADSFASGGWFGVAVWTASAASALTNQVVSATRVASQGTYTLAVYSLSGAQGPGASVAKQSPTSSSVPITAVISATAANSWILGGFLETNDGAGFPASSSTTFHVSNFDTSNGDSHAVGMLSKPTAAPGSVTLGSTASNRYVATAALEILAGVGP